MKSNSKVIVLTLIVAVLVIGVGFATINAINLNISGTATATADQSNFKVEFFGTPTTSDSTKVVAGIDATKKNEATISVSKLSAKGDTATAIYQIKNYSEDLSASLVATVLENTNDEYFSVVPTIAKKDITAGGDTTVEVKVTLLKTPVDADKTTNVKVQVVATPVQPE